MSSSKPQRKKRFVSPAKDFREVDPMRGPRFDRSVYRTELLRERSVLRGINVEQYLERDR